MNNARKLKVFESEILEYLICGFLRVCQRTIPNLALSQQEINGSSQKKTFHIIELLMIFGFENNFLKIILKIN